MNLARYLREERILFLKSKKKEDAFKEMVRAACRSLNIRRNQEIYNAVMERESMHISKLTDVIAIPHATNPHIREYTITLGISKEGVDYYSTDKIPVHVIILLLSNGKNPENHLKVLREIAQLIKKEENVKVLTEAEDTSTVYRLFHTTAKKDEEIVYVPALTRKITQNFLKIAYSSARKLNIPKIFIYGDVFERAYDIHPLPKDLKIYVITKNPKRYSKIGFKPKHILTFPFSDMDRAQQVKTSLLLGTSRKIIKPTDLVMIITGVAKSSLLDTIRVIDVEREFSLFFGDDSKALFTGIKQEVFIRGIQLMLQLAEEGREGKALGTIFVMGDMDNVAKYTKQLVLNPFAGYPEEERNILDPSLEETVKEFATIDGAFIIKSDGVILSAGTYLSPNGASIELPSGLGTRHQAAAAITQVTNAISIAISQSTRTIRIFKKGQIITEL